MEQIQFSRPEEFPQVEIWSVKDCVRRWYVFHETYTICTVSRVIGSAYWKYRGKSHTSASQNLMLLEPGELHYNTQPTPPGTFWVSFIPGSVIEDSAKELGFQLKPHFRLANVAHPALFRAFARFHLSLEETSSTTLERTSRFHHCIGLLLGDYIEEMKTLPTLAPSKAVLRKARDYIVGNFSEKIYLDQLAQLSGLSRFHFLRAFTQEFGLPPHAYQIQARLARVRSLLAAGLSISQVEAETGFCDQSHLTRHFKRAFGVTPGEYAASVRPRLVAVPA